MLTDIKDRLKNISAKVIGSPDKLSLESRIFNTFSLFVFILLLLETVFNLCIGLYVSAGLTFAIWAIQLFLYYLTRFKNKLNISVIFSAIEVHVITGVGYFFNAGITGASLLFFMSSIFVILSVSQRKHWYIWIIFNLLTVLLVIMAEYYYPKSIQQHYSSRSELFADNLASYIITLIMISIGTAAIRGNYIKQKQLADEKTLALELLNAEKVKLFSIIAHDLRTPLASVQQYFTVMTEVDLEPAERAELETNLLSTISNTQELLTNLLKWAKNQMDGSTAYLQPVNLHEFLENTATLFTSIATKKEIEVIIDTYEDITVMADADMLQLVIRNLLNNAVKFTNLNGRIELKAAVHGNNCIISIADNGIGIPIGKQAEIFSLNTISTKGTKKEEGTGLGLVLCKDYTELQGGSIWFSSTEGKGTTFFISLPMYQNRLFSAV